MTEEVKRKIRTMITAEKINTLKRLVDQQKPYKEIATVLDISYASTKRLVKRLMDGEFQEMSNFKTSGQKKSMVTKPHNNEKAVLINALSVHADYTQADLREKLHSNDFNVSQSTVCRILKSMKYTRKRLVKVPVERNSQSVIDQRILYANDLNSIRNESIIFLDETGFNLHTGLSYGYSPINSKAYRTVSANRGKNISLMCSINTEGLLEYELIDGAYNSTKFLLFIQTKILQHLTARNILIMDNVRFHKVSEVIQLIQSTGCGVKFLPPYSPQLNAIEEFFSMVKARYSAINPRAKSRESVKENIRVVLDGNNITTLPFYRSMRRWIEVALARGLFI